MINTVTMICKECGYSQAVKEHEIPKGPCQFCKHGYGFIAWPKKLLMEQFVLIPGDEVFIDSRLPPLHPDRIVEIRRNGLIVYSQEVKCTSR